MQDFHDAAHAPCLDGIAAWAEGSLRVGQFGDAAIVRLLHLDQVRGEDGHDELAAVLSHLLREVMMGPEEETDWPHPFRPLLEIYNVQQSQ